MIEVVQLKKSFGKVEAVKDVSFKAGDGKITGLLGENGAGKSTTIRMISGVLEADYGSISIDGKALNYGDFKNRRSLGVLTDARGLYEKLTSRENIALYAQLHGIDAHSIKNDVGRVIALLGIEDIADRRTLGFSTGQKMKVALARVLINRPRNLILDEPSSGLDVLSTRNLRKVLLQLKAEGCCILLSTHIMQEIDQLCDEVVIIDGGNSLVQKDKSAMLKANNTDRIEDCFVSYLKEGERDVR